MWQLADDVIELKTDGDGGALSVGLAKMSEEQNGSLSRLSN